MPANTTHQERRSVVAFLVFCICVFVLSTSGRIVFPDDEIVFQTTSALYEHGSLDIEGIARRTGEPPGRPPGTFGWAPGPHGERYGFFGHGLSFVAIPMYAAGKVAATHAPPTWKHAVRSDHFFVHPRSQQADWTRLLVGLTNALLTALAAWLLRVWLGILGIRSRVAWLVAFAFAFGTLAWPYTRTFLSEPLSTLVWLLAAIASTRYHAQRDRRPRAAARSLWCSAALVGLSVHIHLLNLIAVPVFIAHAIIPAWSQRRTATRTWMIALGIGALGLAALGLSQWLRFGDPFESGRHGYYSHFILPTTELLALLVSPGRSLWLTSPILLGALWGVRAMGTQRRVALGLCAGLVLTRLLFVATRSDWWGGWAIGPRFLLPVIPFALAPLAWAWSRSTTRVRAALGTVLALSCALQLHLSRHSIFEWMTRLHHDGPETYLHTSHWSLHGHPAWGFTQLEPDLLVVGAWRLAERGHSGLAWIFAGVAALAVSSLAAFVLSVRRGRLRTASHAGDSPRDGIEQAREDHAPR